MWHGAPAVGVAALPRAAACRPPGDGERRGYVCLAPAPDVHVGHGIGQHQHVVRAVVLRVNCARGHGEVRGISKHHRTTAQRAGPAPAGPQTAPHAAMHIKVCMLAGRQHRRAGERSAQARSKRRKRAGVANVLPQPDCTHHRAARSGAETTAAWARAFGQGVLPPPRSAPDRLPPPLQLRPRTSACVLIVRWMLLQVVLWARLRPPRTRARVWASVCSQRCPPRAVVDGLHTRVAGLVC